MGWLHTWAGLTAGWLLYFIFITGTLGYFDTEIDRWMQPEVLPVNNVSQEKMLALAEYRLTNVAPSAQKWWIGLPAKHMPFFEIWWQDPTKPNAKKEGKWHNEKLSPITGQTVTTRETGGGRVLYRMHYALHYMPGVLAYAITSLAAMFMLVGLISGVIIHKKIFKDFFTFRPLKKQRSWLDLHNLLSVLPLPFHLMITYSGLILLMTVTMPGVIASNYGLGKDSYSRFLEDAFAEEHHLDAAGVAAENMSFMNLLGEITNRWGLDQIAYVSIENRSDINGHIEFGHTDYETLANPRTLTFNAVNGELQHHTPASEANAAKQTYDVFSQLHEGLFAGTLLRWLYFLSGLMGAGMVATGSILWAVKRRKSAAKTGRGYRGLIFIERLNAGAIVGIPASIAVYFWANRLLSIDFPSRAEWEVNAMFITLGIALCYSIWRPIARVWIEMLFATAALFAMLPLVSALTTQQNLGNSIKYGDWVMASIELSFLVTGILFAYAAYKVGTTQSLLKNCTTKNMATTAEPLKVAL